MDIQAWLTANWQALAIGGVAGLLLGWLFFYLPTRSRANRYGSEVASLNERLAVSERSLSETRRQAEVAQTDLTAQAVRYNAVQSQLDALQFDQAQLASSQSELDQLRGEMTTLRVTNTGLEDKIRNLRGEVAGELAILSSTMLRMKEEALTNAQQQIADLQAELEARSH